MFGAVAHARRQLHVCAAVSCFTGSCSNQLRMHCILQQQCVQPHCLGQRQGRAHTRVAANSSTDIVFYCSLSFSGLTPLLNLLWLVPSKMVPGPTCNYPLRYADAFFTATLCVPALPACVGHASAALSKRVAEERGEAVGQVVGYSIHGDRWA